ncbi:MAG: 4-hydroxy-tetrahydrodipicolinate synthase [bacterium]
MKKLEGIIPAVVTPFDSNEELNEEGLRTILNFLIDKGVHGLFVVGSTGEFWALTNEEKKRIYDVSVDCVGGRVPLCVGTCANTTREVIDLSRYAERAGADYVSILTPSFIKPSDEELFAHYAAVAEAVDIPILLYSNPSRTGIPLSTKLVASLAERYSNIVGIKDSSGDLTQTTEYIRRCPEGFKVIAGMDTLIFATLVHGGVGAIAASANIVPEIVVGIYENFKRGDLSKALEFQNRLAPLRIAFSLGSFPVVLKEGAEIIGLPAGPARRPIGPMKPEKREELRRIIASLGCDVKR